MTRCTLFIHFLNIILDMPALMGGKKREQPNIELKLLNAFFYLSITHH